MKSADRRKCWFLLVGSVLACGGAQSSRPGTPSPLPVSPSQPAVPTAPTAVASSFKYAPGTVKYRISRSAAIEGNGPDSLGHREISTNITHELLTLEPAVDQALNFTALIDSSATTTQGLIGSVQSIQLPVQVSGSFTDSTLIINTEVSGEKCNAIGSMLATDLHNLLIAFPKQLSTGVSWKDSADVAGCQAGVPASTHTTRSYVVSGDASYSGRPVLVIQRTDTTHAKGEGGLQQHRVSIDASGTGTALYYIDIGSGQIMRLTVDQLFDLGVTASGRRSQFKQISKQDFQIIP